MKLKLQIVFLMLACFVGAVVTAAPTKIEDRYEYSTSLNSIASVIMNWYGSLIVKDDSLTEKIGQVHFNAPNIGDQWSQYRSKYPKNISQVLITHTELLKTNDDYLFNVSSTISYKNHENKIQTRSLKETFVFSSTLMKQATSVASHIKNITLISNAEIAPLNSTEYNRERYKVREFVYAWLVYLDGLDTLKSVMNGDKWLDKASYSLEMGAVKTQGSVDKILKKRKQMLAKGGHLLRSLDVVKSKDSDNTFALSLILEWKGFNDNGKPVLAKIRQEFKIKIKEDKSWQVLSIKEKHLLPTIGPWMGLLC